MAPTMQAWQYANIRGGLQNSLFLNKSANPPSASSLKRHQIRVEVISTAINPADYKIAESLLAALIVKKPATPGQDFCGRVVAAHATITSFREGQLVFGRLEVQPKFGTLGQFVIAPSAGCVPLPPNVLPDDAAAIGTAGLTAYQSLPQDVVKPGARVFINGGSGGTGVFAIQFAKVLGASVAVTCSTGNIELCRSLGADDVIDYTKEDVVNALIARGQVFDIAVDNVGPPGALYKNSERFLKPGAKFIGVGLPGVAAIYNILDSALRPGALGGGHRPFHFLRVKTKSQDLEQIGKWMAEGKVKAVLDAVFEWESAPKAFEMLKTGHPKGKIIVHCMGN